MTTHTLLGVGAAALLLLATTSPVSAQSAKPDTPAASQSGTTSGPAVGTPSTMGSGGTTSATPHQNEAVKDQSSSVTRESGSGTSQSPTGPATGEPGSGGTQAGPAPQDGTAKEKK